MRVFSTLEQKCADACCRLEDLHERSPRPHEPKPVFWLKALFLFAMFVVMSILGGAFFLLSWLTHPKGESA